MSREYWDNWLTRKTDYKIRVDTSFLKEMLQRGLSTVLDIGSGRGGFIKGLGKLGFRITCVDYSLQAVEYLRDVKQDPSIAHLDVVCADILSLPFHCESFGAVTSVCVMNFFLRESERENAFKEVLRVVKPGGLVFCVVMSHEDEGAKQGEQLGNRNVRLPDGICLHYYTPSEIEGLLQGRIHEIETLHKVDTSHDTLHSHAFIRVLASRE